MIYLCYCFIAHGIKSKLSTLEYKLKSLAMLPQIILINETWLDEAIDISGYIAENYCIFRKDRNKNNGGVLALALNFLNPVLVNTYNASVEAVCFEFNVGIEKL